LRPKDTKKAAKIRLFIPFFTAFLFRTKD